MSDLYMRLALVKQAIAVLKTVNDPRRAEALAYYELQLAEIEEKIKKESAEKALAKLGEIEQAVKASQPPDIIIKLKPGIVGIKGQGLSDKEV